jgi:hypothetical protein
MSRIERMKKLELDGRVLDAGRERKRERWELEVVLHLCMRNRRSLRGVREGGTR